jgi:hypothetical protein
MWRRAALVKIYVSNETTASIISVTRVGELVTTLAITSNRRTLRRNIMYYVAYIVILRRVRLLLVIANVVPRSQILVTLMMEVLHSSETSVLTSTTRPHIQKDCILHIHRRENVRSYIIHNLFILKTKDLGSKILFLFSGNPYSKRANWKRYILSPETLFDSLVIFK